MLVPANETDFIWPAAVVVFFNSGCQSTAYQPGKPSRLLTIQQRKEIRIGTTGDYKPYSYSTADSFSGIDIDLGRDLAGFLGVKPRFIQTSWPGLMKDLEDDRFDVALSGISHTAEREEKAFFSQAYAVSGKTPIARCLDRDRLSSLEKTDLPNIRVIVNPGGTNEKFARAHFKHAQIFVYPDNKTIFTQITEKKADVMFTDAEEVKFQVRLLPALCPAMPGQEFEPREKAVLMQKDGPLRDRVNEWIEKLKKDGTLRKFLDKGITGQETR